MVLTAEHSKYSSPFESAKSCPSFILTILLSSKSVLFAINTPKSENSWIFHQHTVNRWHTRHGHTGFLRPDALKPFGTAVEWCLIGDVIDNHHHWWTVPLFKVCKILHWVRFKLMQSLTCFWTSSEKSSLPAESYMNSSYVVQKWKLKHMVVSIWLYAHHRIVCVLNMHRFCTQLHSCSL